MGYSYMPMNSNILEILNIMIKKFLQEKDKNINEKEIMQEFQEYGHEREDINKALKLFYASTDDSRQNFDRSDNIDDIYNRVFTLSEKLYLPIKLQGLIQRLVILSVLNPAESESLITQIINTSYRGTLETSDIWDILEDIVEDETKLNLISQEIPEFEDYFSRNYKYIN